MNLFFLSLLTIFSSSIFATFQNSSAKWWLALELASKMTNDLQTLTSLSLVDKKMNQLSEERLKHHHFNHQVAKSCNPTRIMLMSKTFSKFAATLFESTDSDTIDIGNLQPNCFRAIANGIRFLPHITKLIVKEPYNPDIYEGMIQLFKKFEEDIHILFNQRNNVDTIIFPLYFSEFVPDLTTLNITNVKNWKFGETSNKTILDRYPFIPRANIETLEGKSVVIGID